jgi:hypothetical protein
VDAVIKAVIDKTGSKTRKIGGDTDMSAVPAPQRIEISPAVRAILGADTPKSQLLRHFLRFSDAILAADPAGIDMGLCC